MLFYFFSLGLICSSFMVILINHPVFSLIFLVVSFIFSSFVLFMLECELLAILFIIIYVGAIAVLFLFAIMMLETKLINLSKNKIKYFPLGFIFILFLFFPLVLTINSFNYKYNCLKLKDFYNLFDNFNNNIYQNWYLLIDSINDINIYSYILYSYFITQFLVSGLVLLMILIGVVYLTNSFETYNTIQQSSFKQLSRKSTLFEKK